MTFQVRATNLRAYLDCPRKMNLRSQWRYGGLITPGVMELGSLTHHLLHTQMSSWHLSSDITTSLWKNVDDTLLHSTAKEWCEEKYEGNPQGLATALTQHIPYAISMFRNVIAWFDQQKFFETWEIVAIEQPIKRSVNDSENSAELTGTPDLVLLHKVTGQHGILDYKTAANLGRGLHFADWQMLAYAVMLEGLGFKPYYGMHLRVKRLKFTKRSKPPYVNMEEMRFSDVKLEQGWEKICVLIDRIEHDTIWLPHPTGMCMSSPCSFLDACETMDSTHDHEYVLSATHVRIDLDGSYTEEETPPPPTE